MDVIDSKMASDAFVIVDQDVQCNVMLLLMNVYLNVELSWICADNLLWC